MSRYRTLKHYWVDTNPKSEITPGPNGSILVPPSGTKVFLHWLTDSGKLAATHTLEYATLITTKVTAIGKDNIRINVIDL